MSCGGKFCEGILVTHIVVVRLTLLPILLKTFDRNVSLSIQVTDFFTSYIFVLIVFLLRSEAFVQGTLVNRIAIDLTFITQTAEVFISPV